MKTQRQAVSDEWGVIVNMLPKGWEEQAKTLKAFQRKRYTESPSSLLRLILYHAINDGGLKTTTAQAKAAGIADMSSVALHKRLKTSGPWLQWIAQQLCNEFREQLPETQQLRVRAVDSTTIQCPGSTGSDWRLHYTLDLGTLACDWHEVTPADQAEGLQRTPCSPGDVLIADRGYLRVRGIQSIVSNGGHVVIRMRWNHPRLNDTQGKKVLALSMVKNLRLGQAGDWPVAMVTQSGTAIPGRIIAVKLPVPLADKNRRRLQRNASKKQHAIDERSLDAARYVMLFTTVPASVLSAENITQLYRFRWQIEIAFKRHKQLLQLGKLPHKNPEAARTWIIAKLVVALLLETLYRRAAAFSPWGYSLST